MARQRVVFISGAGNYIPGQVSNAKDANNFVNNAGSTGNPLTAANTPSYGSAINPAVGAITQLAVQTGALSNYGKTLGISQSFLTSAVNTGGLFVELLLNPQRITEEQQKMITKVPTANGYAYFHWGLEPKSIRFEIISKSIRSSVTSDTVNNNAAAAQQNFDQLERFFQVNNFNVGLIYQGKIYVGHFEGKFTKIRDANNPNILTANFTFVIDKIPSITLPGIGSFNVNKLPFGI